MSPDRSLYDLAFALFIRGKASEIATKAQAVHYGIDPITAEERRALPQFPEAAMSPAITRAAARYQLTYLGVRDGTGLLLREAGEASASMPATWDAAIKAWWPVETAPAAAAISQPAPIQAAPTSVLAVTNSADSLFERALEAQLQWQILAVAWDQTTTEQREALNLSAPTPEGAAASNRLFYQLSPTEQMRASQTLQARYRQRIGGEFSRDALLAAARAQSARTRNS